MVFFTCCAGDILRVYVGVAIGFGLWLPVATTRRTRLPRLVDHDELEKKGKLGFVVGGKLNVPTVTIG
jgi:hypothetical protein